MTVVSLSATSKRAKKTSSSDGQASANNRYRRAYYSIGSAKRSLGVTA